MLSRADADDLGLLRRLIHKYPDDAARILAELRNEARPRRGGRKKGAVSRKGELDKYMVPYLENYCRVAKRDLGLKPIPAIRVLVALLNGSNKALGKSDAAAVARLYGKMIAGKYPRPRGWSKHSLLADD